MDSFRLYFEIFYVFRRPLAMPLQMAQYQGPMWMKERYDTDENIDAGYLEILLWWFFDGLDISYPPKAVFKKPRVKLRQSEKWKGTDSYIVLELFFIVKSQIQVNFLGFLVLN